MKYNKDTCVTFSVGSTCRPSTQDSLPPKHVSLAPHPLMFHLPGTPLSCYFAFGIFLLQRQLSHLRVIYLSLRHTLTSLEKNSVCLECLSGRNNNVMTSL